MSSTRPRSHDAIAYGGWFIDTHPPLGVDAPNEPPCTQHRVPHLYDIPLRACVSRDIDNLMFAGRNISATHIAFASTRVMATCSVMGQGVGTAAAYAARHKLPPSTLAANATAIEAIQHQLIEDDAFLIGPINSDPRDLAKRAKVTASSEQSQGAAAQRRRRANPQRAWRRWRPARTHNRRHPPLDERPRRGPPRLDPTRMA